MTTSYRRLVLHPFVVLLMLVAMVFVTAADAARSGFARQRVRVIRSYRRSSG